MKRSASAEWSGDLRTGKGAISTESGAISNQRYGFNMRFGDEKGTNPEELLGAAHAGCFTMALSSELGKAGITAEKIATKAIVELTQGAAGFEIPAVQLDVTVTAPGADKAKVSEAAQTAKANCPLSKVLRAEITMNLALN